MTPTQKTRFISPAVSVPTTCSVSAGGTGYSIDNLAPGIPSGLLVVPVPGGSF